MDSETRRKERLALLKTISLLGCLPEEILAEYCAVKKYEKDEIIFLEGDKNSNIYILLEGLVKLMVFLENGNVLILNFVTEGDFFGDVSTQIEKVSAVAHVSTNVVAITKAAFKKLLQNYEFSIQFIAMLCHRNNLYRERLLLKSIKLAKKRLAAADEALSVITNGKYKLTHEEIAQYCSLSRETVTRVFLLMKEDNNMKQS